ncbi:hypothetical protein BH10BAC5_BH10BAC5_04400 [soil metagenome]
MNSEINFLFSKYEERVLIIGYKLREFVLKNLNDIEEKADLPANLIGYGYGSGYKDMICTIIASKKGMKLGFYKGSELPDPQKLLKGSGKVHKFVEINSLEDISASGLTKLLADALNAYRIRSSKQ